MEVREGKGLRIIIEHPGMFFDEEKIKSLGDHTVSKIYDEKKNSFQDIYIFRPSLPEAVGISITKTQIQVDTKEPDSNNCLEVLERIMEGTEDVWIRKISCTYYEGYTSRSYQELVDFGIPNLLQDLPPEYLQRTATINGYLGDFDFEKTDKIYRCKASFFGMEDAITFSSKTTLEVENFSDTPEEILGIIKEMIKHAKTYKRVVREGI